MTNRTNKTNTTKIKTCNVFPRVWAAIYGCEGRGEFWRRDFDGREVYEVYACPGCRAIKSVTECFSTAAIQAHLHEAQDLAGVENYRYQRTGRDRKTGRPYLVIEGRAVFVPSILDRWPEFSPIEGGR